MSELVVTDDERRSRIARRHLVVPSARADRLEHVADAMVGLHSSDPVTVYLSAAARLRDATIEAIDDALHSRRAVVRHHAMRRTLWVFTPDVARIAHASSTVALIAPLRRTLGKLLVENDVTDDPDRWLDEAINATTGALAARGEATTRELGDAVPSLRAPLAFASAKTYGGSIAAHTRVLTLMGFMGIIIRGRPLGSWISGQYRWTLADSSFPGALDPDETDGPDEAAAALVDRYLSTFGPASLTDVQWWTGWTKRKSTTAIERAGGTIHESVTGDPLIVARGDSAITDIEAPWVAVLPGLDPTTMGWKDRSWYLPDEYVPALFDRNGNAGPTIWADGRVVGGWMQRPDGSIATRLLEPIGQQHQRLLDDELERVRSFVGDTRFTVRFPTPLSKELAAS